ncbi:Zn(II)2Cys6 transcription factor [Aspergillus clavatus NRRL 1]|uniref:C6 zinc finger domain protein n=1 Tax=Aspergillus clavatus (strain ATCC 1007 / CBS 513.65 / DSM 816 / NCTC 3887 / NRRL 1 / QM 1276 / 107) TaxID=344612 RepID=A1CGJ9_ASPCL|nr:C6 zinc finger domain protein [Aspergillus clavatus NRRL 1]EAW11079.1 C6 zinc finger domain protein [Aspergillus clavatus NRRL 1]
MPPRLHRKVAKTKTFAGCWTCRRRKVKCDNHRPQCARCGESCEGYDVDLYWMDEGRERPCTVKRKAMLIQDPRLPQEIDLVEVDDMLGKLDAIVGEAGAGTIGAFSAFTVDEYDMPSSSNEGSSEPDIAGMPNETLGLELTTIAPEMSLYIDTDVAELMDNYIHVVADLLQPARHTQNPYRSIYVPRAMEAAASGWVVGVGGTSSQGGTALFHALLAVSAFHMHQNQPDIPRYQRLGRLHRLKAVESLQKSLAEGESAADYHTTMSAMLSMVSIDLMEGSMTEFWIHLEGCEKLRLSLQNSQLCSSRHDQLLTICSFMSTLSRSTNPYLEPKPWREHPSVSIDHLLRISPFLPDNHSLEFTYGTTATLASYMSLAILLSQHLCYYEVHNLPLPPSLEEVCAALDRALLTWSISDEPLSSVPDGDYQTLSLVSCHILAFHAAVVIYFHTLTHVRSASVLRHYNKICVSNLLAAEALKSSHGSQIGWNAMAPIVWPGFIAACEAELEERPLWRAWWIGVQRYCIGSIHTLWDVVQEVWQDENPYDRGPKWKAVLGRRGRRVMSGG